jgi:CRISPR/Cas system-associated exonuclease Cas4 (RecB family)
VHSKLQISGDALKGLQIMGLLETRNLDYSHVIHLSCNERNLPPDGHIPSFVPYDLQREAGWLMQNEREYIYAFHFFRSNQRAKNIYLLYNTETDELGSGEVSRFIRSLQLYYTSRNPQITWSDSLAEFKNYGSSLPGNQISIPKSPEVMQRVNEFLESRELSATSLNSLRKCSLQFYFKYLSRIREPEKDEGFLSPTESGMLTHKVLEYAMISMVSRQIDKNALPLYEETILQLFAKAAKELFPEKDFSLGEGLMQKTFLCSNVKRILEITAAEDHGAYLRGNEVEGKKKLAVNGRALGFIGTADRIQQRDSVIEILDYKTGKLEKNDLKTQGWDSLGNHKKRDELFQLLFYAWLFFEEGKEIKPFIISIRSGEFTKLSAQVGGVESFQQVHMEMIETLLSGLVSGLLDEGTEFTQTPEKENCKFCNFNTLCKSEDNEQAEDIAG